jgi:hypothetical protein
MCLNGSKETIASNNHAGGKCNEVDLTKNSFRYNKSTKETYNLGDMFSLNLIDESVHSALKLHRSLSKDVISVGWDVMITDDTCYFLEGNVPAGSVLIDALFTFCVFPRFEKISKAATPVNAIVIVRLIIFFYFLISFDFKYFAQFKIVCLSNFDADSHSPMLFR